MSSGWQSKKLVDVCEIKPPKAEARRKLAERDLVTFVPMEDLGIEQKFLMPTQTKPLADVAGSYTYFADGDVLLAKITPCFENGKLGIATNLVNGVGFGSSEYIVFRPNKLLDKEWLYYFLSRESFLLEGARHMSGSVGHKRVTKEFIEASLIPAPPLPEQQRIVRVLDEAFAGIATATQNAQKNLQNARDLFKSQLQSIFTTKDDGWEKRRLVDITSKLGDGLHGTPEYIDDGDYYFINGNNLNDGSIRYKEQTKRVSSAEYKKHKKELNNRTVLVSINGTLGNVAFYNNENIILGKSACYFNLNENIDKNYIKHLISSPYFVEYAHKEATGATIKNVSLKTMRNFMVPLPSLTEQQRIVSRLDTLSADTKHLEAIYQQKLDNLAALKQSILQKAFAGELNTDRLAA